MPVGTKSLAAKGLGKTRPVTLLVATRNREFEFPKDLAQAPLLHGGVYCVHIHTDDVCCHVPCTFLSIVTLHGTKESGTNPSRSSLTR